MTHLIGAFCEWQKRIFDVSSPCMCWLDQQEWNHQLVWLGHHWMFNVFIPTIWANPHWYIDVWFHSKGLVSRWFPFMVQSLHQPSTDVTKTTKSIWSPCCLVKPLPRGESSRIIQEWPCAEVAMILPIFYGHNLWCTTQNLIPWNQSWTIDSQTANEPH